MLGLITTKKMKFSFKDFFSKCEQFPEVWWKTLFFVCSDFSLRDYIQIEKNNEHSYPDLYMNFEKTNTKLVAYTKQVEEENHVMVRSPSGGIDIIVLFF